MGGFPADERDPFTPALATLARAWAEVAELVVVPLRYPAGGAGREEAPGDVVQAAPYAAHGARVVPVGRGDPRLRRSAPLWRAAVATIAAEHGDRPFDLVHALQAAEPGFVAALAARRIGRPLVVQTVGGELASDAASGFGDQRDPAGRRFVAFALRVAARVACGSRPVLAAARTLLGPRRASRARLLGWPYDDARFRPRLGRDRRAELAAGAAPSRFLCVADLRPVKDHATLLEAFALLIADGAGAARDARLDLVGGGPRLATLRRLAQELGVAERIRWWGQVPHPAVHVAFAGADAYAQASRWEGQGLTLLEAAASGLPIAATAVGVAPELPDAARFLAPPGDAPALARAMAAALAAAPLDGPTRRARRAAVRARWGAVASAEGVLGLWEEVLREARTGARAGR